MIVIPSKSSIPMIFLCFLHSSVYSIPITRDNFSLIFPESPHPPVFVALVSEHCGNCETFFPIWEKLAAHFHNNDRVLIGSITCNQEQRLCNQFPDFLTPTLWWVRTTVSDAEQYIGADTFAELSSFVEKQLSPSVIDILNETEFERQLSIHQNSSLFLIQNLATSVVDQIRELSQNFENYPCHFFLLSFRRFPTNDPFFANYFHPTERLIVFKDEVNKSNLQFFIEKFVFPPISAISKSFFTHARNIGSTVLILSDEPPYFESNLPQLSRRLPEDLRCGVLHCSDNPRACFHLVITKGKGPFLLMHNPLKKFHWYYRGELVDDAIVKWVKEVLSGRVRPVGPGAGFLGFLRNLLDLAMVRGTGMVSLLVSILVVFVVVFVLGIMQTIRSRHRGTFRKFD
jgi:thiol-disulfide isomerase/thioredoxin